MRLERPFRRLHLLCLAAASFLAGASGGALLGACGPFTDLSDPAFCPFVLEIFTLGITTGTTPSTYDPAGSVSRLQMAAFVSRAVDAMLRRGGRRAPLSQAWKGASNPASGLGRTAVNSPLFVKADGVDLWVSSVASGTVQRVRGSDGRLLETWTGASVAQGVLAAAGRIFAAGGSAPGRLYRIDPSQTAGAVTTVSSALGNSPGALTFDGSRIWTANLASSISIVTPGATTPWTVTTVTAGFTEPVGILYDGTNVWVSDDLADSIFQLSSAGAILLTVTVGSGPKYPIYDGANIWVPDFGADSVTVVRALTGSVLATLTGNGLASPYVAAFDGERVLVTNLGGDSVSVWTAAGLAPLGSFSTGIGTSPYGACSDGVNFWIALSDAASLLRF